MHDDIPSRPTLGRVGVPDPLCSEVGESSCAWTTVNISEVFPGLPTPLTWSFHEQGFELGLHGAFNDLGVLPSSAVRVADNRDERVCAMFRGRPFMNVDRFRLFADLMPGTNGDIMERQIFGNERAGVAATPMDWRRYPLIATRMPRAALTVRRRLERETATLHSWWRTSTADGALREVADAREALATAVRRFNRTFRPHCLAMLIGQGAFEQIVRLCADIGRPDLVNNLVGGDLIEVAMLNELWEVSRGQRGLDGFVAEHGFHGPNEGELASRSWREERGPLTDLLRTYSTMGDDIGPTAMHARRLTRRRDAEKAFLAALTPTRRATARMILAFAQRIVPCREIGKAAYMRTVDVGRAASRAIGAQLAARGVLAEPDDVFMLTVTELLSAVGGDVVVDIGARRERWEEFAALEYPQFCLGTPMPLAEPTGPADSAESIAGLPVAPGIVRGRARLVSDPSACELEPGDVLICASTDPSWITLFVIASAVVIDIGGPMSHGAIVARELGIPCVINTKDGTRRIPDGAEVVVDGGTGTVTVLTA